MKLQVAQLCPTLCDPMDFTFHGILQARILAGVAFPYFKGFSQARDRTQISRIVGRFFTSWATRAAQEYCSGYPIPSPADVPEPGIKSVSSALQADSLPTELLVIPKERQAKECSNYHTIVLISHASKVMLKILQARLQTVCELWNSRCSSWI